MRSFSFHRTVFCLVAIAATATIAGCGGEDEDPLTKAEFVAQANSICKQTDQEVLQRLSTYVKEQPDEGAGQTQSQLFAGAVDEILLPATETSMEDIGSLEPPPDGERQVDAYLGAMERGVAAVEGTAPTYAPLKNSLYEFEKRFSAAEKIAAEYGLKSCQ